MGRPTKHGLDYFYVVCDPEDKIEYLEAKHGIVGYGVLVKLWRRIYKLHGYWCEWDERAQFLFAKEVGIPVDQVLEIVETCFKENIFSRTKYEELLILTSSGTQKFFLEVCRLAKRKNSTIDVKHSLPIKTPEETKKTPEKSGGNHSKSRNNPEESAQSKVKESKDLMSTTYSADAGAPADEKNPIVGIKEPDVVNKLANKKKAAPRRGKTGKTESTPEDKLFIKIKIHWWEWFMKRNDSTSPKFDGASGSAIKRICKYLIAEGRKKNYTEEQMIYDFAFEQFALILARWEELKTNRFLYTSVDIKSISSNLNSIVNYFNHGNKTNIGNTENGVTGSKSDRKMAALAGWGLKVPSGGAGA